MKNLIELSNLLKQKSRFEEVIEVKDKKMVTIDFNIIKLLAIISGQLGDLIAAANGAGIPHIFLGRGFNDGLIGAGGLWSAIVSLWSLTLKK